MNASPAARPIVIFCCTASTEYGFAYDLALYEHAVWEQEHRAEEEQRELEADRAARLAAPCECCGEWPDDVGALALDGDAALCVGCRGENLDDHNHTWNTCPHRECVGFRVNEDCFDA